MCDKVISGATLVRAGRPGAERSYCGVCALQGRVTDPDSLSPSHEPGLLGVTDPGGSEPRTGRLESRTRTACVRVTDPGGSSHGPGRLDESESQLSLGTGLGSRGGRCDGAASLTE